ncbi:hypothetical protein BDW68DRAFT_23834 [Aspergillus falconensis]
MSTLLLKKDTDSQFLLPWRNYHKDAVAAIPNCPSTIANKVEITQGLNHRRDLVGYGIETPLSWAAREGRVEIVKFLLQSGE